MSTVPEQHPPPGSQHDNGDNSTWLSRLTDATSFWMLLILLSMVAVFSLISPNNAFFSLNNFFTIALNASQLVLLAVGMTFLLGAREFDLSIGANVVLSSILAAKTITALAGSADEVAMGEYPHLPVAIVCGILVAILSGVIFGTVNGLLVTRLKLSSFLVTLATTTIGLGIALVITHGANVPNIPRTLQTSFATYRIAGLIPLPVVLSLTIVFLLWFVLAKTRFGIHTLAVGSSANAAQRAGINVMSHKLVLFSLMGLLCGIAAMLDISRFATTNIGGHQTDSLQAIAAAVIGGTSLFGGIASVQGTLIGTLIPVVLSTGLVIMGLDSFYQLIVVGFIVIVAVYIDQRNRQRSL
ncbi:ABC transporter permease [Brenneria nigrifluens]|uniref:ABC transporter permease n=2 Tax=Brenneria nigrifluens TaxID=55210 RepID=A0A2U1UWK3_9GAMM|nr:MULTISPECIES: ABC transporter permease [Brenneria]EHD22568.1 ABC-type transporter, integral membrane subunit [Brenneria sp. EniD312]PWC26059.1 ABC transporter permease [Brenneria nigrifluens] [Brenneria nigrifluens DSM 30175 = ATCC 13028]QCR05557.1 ABC transporter permease [Brenneria nigrifluens] [Brenneria nigrifluens DSM 30175 = ATCC 13028]